VKALRFLSKDVVREFASDRRAAVMILFGLAIIPVITSVGAAVDYSRALAAKDRLTIIADGAALEAVTKTSMQTRRTLPDYGKATTETLFRTQAGAIPDVTLTELKVDIAQTFTRRDVTIEYKANVRNYFASFLMGETTLVSGKSTAATSIIYMDFYLVLDNSPSMGLAATLSDIAKMEAVTAAHPSHPRCAFACHEANNPNNFYNVARANNIKLRIDLVREATQKLIDRATDTEIVTDQFRVGLFTLNMALQQISPLTADLAAARTSAENVQLVVLPYNGHNGNKYTNFTGLIPYADVLPTGGDGMSASSPQMVMFLVSDGVADETTNPRVKPVPAALCDKIKAKNIKIAALYTTYHPMPHHGSYNSEVKPIADQIAPAMQACASPGLYFEVSPSQGIAEALQTLFQRAVGQARLMN
jgi:Flp pilus assembly protein TadG